MENVYVRLLSLPDGIKGCVTLDEEGDYNIYINDRFCHEQQIQVLEHEVQHIGSGHLCEISTVSNCESSIKGK